jgi:hypothetical protein
VREPRTPKAVKRSNELHERVRAFALASASRLPGPGPEPDTFESLAVAIAEYQYDYNPGFSRLLESQGKSLSPQKLPALPTDAFRYARVAVHPQELDEVVFLTSGTTGAPGRHPVRTLGTKEALTLIQSRATIFSEVRRGIVVALAPIPAEKHSSSLSHMMELFMREYDGRSISPDPAGAAFRSRSSQRWLANDRGIDVDGLIRAAKIALVRSEPLFVLSTSFALLATLEELDGRKIRLPSRSRIMLTGGFKGHRTEVSEEDLRQMVSAAFGVEDSRIIGEYGMTELTSQLFEVPGRRRYLPPPWLQVRALDPVTREQKPRGEPGLAHFVDLGNIDSCLSVITRDLISVHADGIELHGRAPRAIPRGCSLPFEQQLGKAAP